MSSCLTGVPQCDKGERAEEEGAGHRGTRGGKETGATEKETPEEPARGTRGTPCRGRDGAGGLPRRAQALG